MLLLNNDCLLIFKTLSERQSVWIQIYRELIGLDLGNDYKQMTQVVKANMVRMDTASVFVTIKKFLLPHGLNKTVGQI